MATIIDVAKAANVSTATVSRVINGKYNVTSSKRELVMKAIEEVGYVIPHRSNPELLSKLKSSLAPLSERKIVLIIASDLIPSIVEPFQYTAEELGYSTIITHYENPTQLPILEQTIHSIESVLVGILMINCAYNTPELQNLLTGYPLVQIGAPIMESTYNIVVYNDEIAMGKDAAKFLLDQGCKKIGILTSEIRKETPLFRAKKRVDGYYLALIERNIPVDPSLVAYVDVSIDGGYEGTKQLLQAHPDLDGIIGITNTLTQGAIYAIRRAGKDTSDIQLFSLDKSEVWDFTHNNFPYINPNHEEMATCAVHLLLNAANGSIQRDYHINIPHTVCASTEH